MCTSIVVTFLLASASAVLAGDILRPCEGPCTRELNPVCGTDGRSFKLFNNPCLLKNQHCLDGRTWTLTRMSGCQAPFEVEEDCEIPCTREFFPVCGTNGKSFKMFPNMCTMMNQRCKDGSAWMKTRMQECENVDESRNLACEIPCTREYAPICGSDGVNYKIFANKCVLKNEQCKTGQEWFETRMSACPETRCEKPCTREFMAVCGTDGTQHKIFPNQCVLNNEHCKDGHEWFQSRMSDCVAIAKGEKKGGSNCGVPCTREYRPICGTNGAVNKIFSNKCLLKNQFCEDGLQWSETRLSDCEL